MSDIRVVVPLPNNLKLTSSTTPINGIKEVDSNTLYSKSARATNAMDVSFRVAFGRSPSIRIVINGKFIVDNCRNFGHVETSGNQVGGNQESATIVVPELVRNSRSLSR
jgi:hypothetical protein